VDARNVLHAGESRLLGGIVSQRSIKQWTDKTRRAAFVDACQRLELELRMGTARRHLDVLVQYADLLLDSIVGTLDNFAKDGRIRLAGLRHRVETRGRAANDVRVS
jgi:hypothetical protein